MVWIQLATKHHTGAGIGQEKTRRVYLNNAKREGTTVITIIKWYNKSLLTAAAGHPATVWNCSSPASLALYIHGAWCRYGIEYPIGWLHLASLDLEINRILAEPRTLPQGTACEKTHQAATAARAHSWNILVRHEISQSWWWKTNKTPEEEKAAAGTIKAGIRANQVFSCRKGNWHRWSRDTAI